MKDLTIFTIVSVGIMIFCLFMTPRNNQTGGGELSPKNSMRKALIDECLNSDNDEKIGKAVKEYNITSTDRADICEQITDNFIKQIM